MNILFVSDTYYPHVNGVYYFICRMGPMLKRRGHHIAVIAPSQGGRYTHKVIDTIDVIGMPSVPNPLYPSVRFPLPFQLRSRMRQVIRSFRPDVIHIQDHFFLSRTIIPVARPLGIPVIATNHFLPENLTSFLPNERWRNIAERKMWSLFSKVYNEVSLVTTPTETGAKLIRPKLNVEVLAVSSGIDLKQFSPGADNGHLRQHYGIPAGPMLLFVGRLDPEKKLDHILKAVKLAGNLADFIFVVAGRGAGSTALKTEARKLGISDRVVFTGFIPEADLPRLYRLSRCFIIASGAELLSLATLQALATGLPVIAARAGALEELVKDGANGYLFSPGDIEEMSRCIVRIMTNQDLCRQMSSVSLKIAPIHDLNRTTDVFESIYEEECCNWKMATVLTTG